MRTKGELREGEKYGTYKLAHAVEWYDEDGNEKSDPNPPWSGALIDYEKDKIN